MPSVLFVCTANRFRSPLAESFFKDEIKTLNLPGWNVSSAGTWTISGLPVLDSANRIAKVYDLDITSFKSNPINIQMLKNFDLILVMESSHKEALEIEFPAAKNRIFLLSEAAGQEPFDISDPTIENESPESIGHELYSLIREGFQQITRLAISIENKISPG
jgi:protein-tyrosine phosphatase